MIYTVGSGWLAIYLLLAVVAVIAAYYAIKDYSLGVGVILFLLVPAFIYLAIFAGIHFRVDINHRALLVDTVNQRVIGVREAGVQSRPLIGVKPYDFPATKATQVFLDLYEGVASASSKEHIALLVDTKLFLDLSEVDLPSVYAAVNGDWKVFLDQYLETQLLNIVRETSTQYLVVEHETRRVDWANSFEEAVEIFFSDPGKGFGIRLVPGRTTMTWDFVYEADAEAYDSAHRTEYLIEKRLAEERALEIEVRMAEKRAEILENTAGGTIRAWGEVVDFIELQPSGIQEFLSQYMGLQANLEYLRLVGQLEPEVFFPPNGGPITTYPVNIQEEDGVEQSTPVVVEESTPVVEEETQ
jgi:hypothetical protein